MNDAYIRHALRTGYRQDRNLKRAPFVFCGVLLILLTVSLAAALL
jgi:hypothetical protein